MIQSFLPNKILVVVFVIFLILISQSAYACSVTSDYYRPSNFELIESADAIVIAKVVGRQKGDSDDRVPLSPVFEITKHIKNKSVETIDSSRTYVSFGPIGKQEPSDPDNISDPHPDSYSGACNRSVFQKGRSYVLFLREYDGKFGIGGAAFSRVAEDYYGEDSAWMKTINYHLKIQEMPDRYEQLNALSADYDSMKSKPKSSFEYKLSLDIADHLMSRSPEKPTRYLLETYRALENGEKLPFAIRPPDRNPEFDVHPELAAMEALIMGQSLEDKKKEKNLRDQQLEQLLNALAKGDHPESISLFEELVAKKDVPVSTYAHYFRVLAKSKRYEDLIALADPLAFKFVATADARDAASVISSISGEMRNYRDENPRWKQNRVTRDWWPTFELGLIMNYNKRFNEDWSLNKDIIEDVRPENYRDNPELTLLIAKSYDKSVREWAIEEVWRLIDSEVIAFDKQFNLPIGVLLATYRPSNSGDLEAIFCHEDIGRGALLKSFGLYETVYTDKLAYQMAAYELKDSEKSYLLRSLYILAGDDWEEYATKRGWGSSEFSDLIEIIHKAENVDLKAEKLKALKCPVD